MVSRMFTFSVTPKVIFSLVLTIIVPVCARSQSFRAENRPRAGDAHSIPSMTLTESGSGLSRMITVESTGLFRLVFEAADNWGLDGNHPA